MLQQKTTQHGGFADDIEEAPFLSKMYAFQFWFLAMIYVVVACFLGDGQHCTKAKPWHNYTLYTALLRIHPSPHLPP